MFFISQKKFGCKVLSLVVLIFLLEFYLPDYLLAAQINTQSPKLGPVLMLLKQDQDFKVIFDFAGPSIKLTNKLPIIQDRQPKKVRYIRVTGYSSTQDQTDSTPFITANGKRVYDGLVATNCLPFGTLIKFPEYFSDKEFTVNDRMHSRYHCSADIWFPSRHQATQFGVKYLNMEIY